MRVSVFINECPIQMALVNKISKNITVDAVFRSKNIVNNNQKKILMYYLNATNKNSF